MAIGKDEELKRKVTEDLQEEKIKSMRAQVTRDRELARSAFIDKIEKGRYITDARGQKVDRWEELADETDRAMKMEGQAYITWASSLFTLIELYLKQCDALNQDLTELATHAGYLLLDGTNIMGLPIPGLRALSDKLGDTLSGPPEVVMPKLTYLVELKDDNKLDFKTLQRYENDTIGQKIDSTFEEGVYKWLKDRNYKAADPNNEKNSTWINKDTGAELNKEQFNILKNDPVTGLGKVLSEHFEMDLEERPAPRP